jgi:RNA polymerase subunit RPABC4/transcription elongation factor Spt4
VRVRAQGRTASQEAADRRAQYLRRKARGYYGSSEFKQSRREYELRARHKCLDCDQMVNRTSKRCRTCQVKQVDERTGRPLMPEIRQVVVRSQCPVCRVGMRSIEWRGRWYLHCPGCGLERAKFPAQEVA